MSRRKKKDGGRNSSPPADSPSKSAPLGKWIVGIGALLVVGLVAGWFFEERFGERDAVPAKLSSVPVATFALAPEKETFAKYAGSSSCRDCHAEAFAHWQGSHHGLAERAVTPELDRAAFEPPREIRAGQQVSEARIDAAHFQLVTLGLKGREPFKVERVIGVDPLRQFLIPAEGGRWQTAELTWDPRKQEWFNVFGDEDRQPGEWGHWTGRGMTWNQMCAACHNTRVRKNYDAATDTYRTAMAEMSVGCESCHGPLRAHVDWQKAYPQQRGDPTLTKLSRDQMLDTCGTCHSRRGEITGDFVPGDRYFDHYSLSIPDQSDIFYPDGQIRDEDYEFTSFLGSKMHGAGVRCVDCHEPHSAKTRTTGNALCLTCHGSPVSPVPGVAAAPQIADPAHSFHAAGTPGSNCVDCHMPQTTYMQRHPRHDHGFTIPDPLLTRDHGIPNACQRCHADKPVEWALAAVEQHYGEKMNRPTRTRAHHLALARSGAPEARTPLLQMLAAEKQPLWRAAAVAMLRGAAGAPGVAPALIAATNDPHELVRSMAARALEGAPSGSGTLQMLLNDPVRLVRTDAAWALRNSVNEKSLAAAELRHQLEHNRDQPLGMAQWADYLRNRGDRAGAIAMLRRAVELDPGSPPLRQNLAVALSESGQSADAANELSEAVRLAPKDAQLRFTHALALNEANRPVEALAALEETVKLDPRFARAWYNLGLARNAAQQTELALIALRRAEALDPRDPQAPFAAATILARQQKTQEALAAAQRALQIAPGYRDAAELVRVLSASGAR